MDAGRAAILGIRSSQSLTSTKVNFEYTPIAEHVTEFWEYSEWQLGSKLPPIGSPAAPHRCLPVCVESSLPFCEAPPTAPCPKWQLSRLLELQTPSGWLGLELKLASRLVTASRLVGLILPHSHGF